MIYRIIHSTAEDTPAFEPVTVDDDHIPHRGDQVTVGEKFFLVVGVMHAVKPKGMTLKKIQAATQGEITEGYEPRPSELRTSVFVQ